MTFARKIFYFIFCIYRFKFILKIHWYWNFILYRRDISLCCIWIIICQMNLESLKKLPFHYCKMFYLPFQFYLHWVYVKFDLCIFRLMRMSSKRTIDFNQHVLLAKLIGYLLRMFIHDLVATLPWISTLLSVF